MRLMIWRSQSSSEAPVPDLGALKQDACQKNYGQEGLVTSKGAACTLKHNPGQKKVGDENGQ